MKTTETIKNVAVVGLGYVGLPLALRCVEKQYETWGIELSEEKIQLIKNGKSPIKEEFIEQRTADLKKIKVTNDPKVIKNVDVALICVPTPVDEQFYPILDPVKSAAKMIAANLKKGMLVVVESTINPGVCEEVVEPIFAEAGWKEGKDYYLAHCPERIDPGNKTWNVTNIPRVVGAMSPKGLIVAQIFFESIINATIRPMKYIREAEAVKIVENSFRDINIAFVNELARSFDQMDIDIKDVIEGAATKPYAFMPHFPSCGVGGHCIPVDPYYLIERAKKNGFDHRFLRTARAINNDMPIYTVELMQDLLNEVKLPMKGTNVGVLGLAYKADVDDLRESPSIKIIAALKKKGCKVLTYDPFLTKMSDVLTMENFLKKVDAIILATNHTPFIETDETLFKKFGIKAIVDGKNCLNGTKIKKLGIKYHGIGRK